MLKVKQVAERLNVSSSIVYALIDGGALKCNRIGLGRGTIRVSEDALREYLQRNEQGGASIPLSPDGKPLLKHLTL